MSGAGIENLDFLNDDWNIISINQLQGNISNSQSLAFSFDVISINSSDRTISSLRIDDNVFISNIEGLIINNSPKDSNSKYVLFVFVEDELTKRKFTNLVSNIRNYCSVILTNKELLNGGYILNGKVFTKKVVENAYDYWTILFQLKNNQNKLESGSNNSNTSTVKKNNIKDKDTNNNNNANANSNSNNKSVNIDEFYSKEKENQKKLKLMSIKELEQIIDKNQQHLHT